MPPKARSDAEEASFLDGLLSELDSNAPPPARAASPMRRRVTTASEPTPRTPRRAPQSTRGAPTPQATQRAKNVAEIVDMSALVDGAEDWDWDDMNDDFMSPVKLNSPVRPKRSRYDVGPDTSRAPVATRCIVRTVRETAGGRPQKILTVDTIPGKDTRQVTLQDDWTHSNVQVGDIVNFIGDWTERSPSAQLAMTVSLKHNFFIHHPDVLLTPTALSNTAQCMRKPLLTNMVRSSSDVTPALVWGNMLHEVMQTCLSVARWDDSFMNAKIENVCRAGMSELVRIDMDVPQAISEVTVRARGIKAFAEKYIAPEPKPNAVLTNTRAGKDESTLLAIPQLYDIEEDIWSPTYGLKGKIDASVQAVIHEVDDSSTPFARANPQVKKTASPMPFEIKTGRAMAGMEHRAQTMLYTLLMGERYGTESPSGLLYYTQSEEVVRVPAARNEIRALLVARNQMAGHMMDRLRAQSTITIHEDEEGVDVVEHLDSSLPPTIDDNRVCGRCYTLDTCMLFRKAVEGVEDTTSDIRDIYQLKTGHLTQTQINFFKKWETLVSLEERDLVRFRKELWMLTAHEREDKGRCFADMVLDAAPPSFAPTSVKDPRTHRSTYRFVRAAEGDPARSLLSGHMGVGDAVVVSVDPGLFALARGFIAELGPDSIVVGVDHALDEQMIKDRLRGKRVPVPETVVFRIDKDEMFGGMTRIRDNLAQLFYAGADVRRLELLVDLAPPRFLDGDQVEEIEASYLNEDQKLAVKTVMRALDYALILGMPGTGKTTVVAEIIRRLVAEGKSVLLTSYTHSAVDTILMKLDGCDVLRLGNMDKIHPAAQKYTLAARPPAKTIEQLENQLMTPLIVKNPAARKGGLDVSLFRLLSDAHPEAVVDLTYQYRMNADIMLLSNRLIYSDRLKCGSSTVASQTLKLSNPGFVDFLHAKSACRRACWMQRLMNESTTAVFVDTDAVPARDSRVGDLIENQTEAKLVYQITECLLGCGVREEQIGVISLYRQQLKQLAHLLRERKGIEILTADRSQGRDKDCVIMSLVRSNDDGLVGELVKDWRRMNVSFTRSRSKLVVVGSRKTLQAEPLFSRFFELMEGQDWILALPPDAHLMHDFNDIEGTPKKRTAADMLHEDSAPSQERAGSAKKSKSGEGILKGRPLLRDVVNDLKSPHIELIEID
ncbi:Dna2-domain-containing protein [Epithele typhae]|uniref:Dna2-domain-containing protein n=1 Tax=Epithele typhae TaxID=378194 RepID=UPI002007D5F7|nr:Dna2-domain-containing protein [Epithele typhae]KAH9914176.1 Dna2-domain-containing protein [Epithele typhae]